LTHLEEFIRGTMLKDKKATDGLVAQVMPQIHAWMRGTGVHPSNTDDAAQDCITKIVVALWRGNYTHRGPAQFLAWCYRIVQNRLRNEQRFHHKQGKVSLEDLDEARLCDSRLGPVDITELQETAQTIQDFLRQLPESDRLVINLKYFADMRTGNVATAMNMSKRRVRIRLGRGIKELRERLTLAMSSAT
jgi:RNA polymerase sigma-70 factor (ECF subfamily)